MKRERSEEKERGREVKRERERQRDRETGAALTSAYLSSVMMSLWPEYCQARRRAKSLASDLREERERGRSSSL